MQDIHSIGGGRLFGGGRGRGDWRLRPHRHQNNHQALKCPRCDSLNTKFCYYNNYNFSQPRHFCKSCRRYWTKGGVLRNVPVGGACRKTKRNFKTKPSADHSSAQTQTQTQTTTTQRERKANYHSSSESSTTLTVTNHANVEAVSVHSSSSVSNGLSSMNDNTKLFSNNNELPAVFEPATNALLEQGSSDGGIFSEIGSFTSLITFSSETALPFGFSNLLNFQQSLEPWQQQQEQQKMVSMSDELKMQDMTSGFLDQTVQVELSNNEGFESLDWYGSGDQGLFDLPNVVDRASYWSQSTQWTDQDQPSLSLP